MRWASSDIAVASDTQGNLDPLSLIAGGDAMARAIDEILDATSGRPHIFNLGHGITPRPRSNMSMICWRGQEAKFHEL